MELFEGTKALCAVNLFNRPGAGGSQSIHETSMSTPRNQREEKGGGFHRSKPETTYEKILRLGVKDETRKRQAKKKTQDRSLEEINHLAVAREHHLARWRGGFEETKSAMNNSLIQHLVKRSEDREMVNDDHSLMNNAYKIACEKRADRDQHTIWEKARMMGNSQSSSSLRPLRGGRAGYSSTSSLLPPQTHGGRRSRPMSISPREREREGERKHSYSPRTHTMHTAERERRPSPRMAMRTLNKSATTPALRREVAR